MNGIQLMIDRTNLFVVGLSFLLKDKKMKNRTEELIWRRIYSRIKKDFFYGMIMRSSNFKWRKKLCHIIFSVIQSMEFKKEFKSLTNDRLFPKLTPWSSWIKNANTVVEATIYLTTIMIECNTVSRCYLILSKIK